MLENSPCSERIAARAASREPASVRSAAASPRGGGGCGRAGGDEVGDRLGLREIDLVVEECALGEFTGPRATRAELHAALGEGFEGLTRSGRRGRQRAAPRT